MTGRVPAGDPERGPAPGRVPGLAGAVLAGGAGRRMGQDKALMPVHGTAMAAVVAASLSAAGADPVGLVGGDRQVHQSLGLAVVPDRWPGEGPLAGMATAVTWAGSDAAGAADLVVVAACDQPAVSPETFSALVRALDPADESVLGAVVRSPDGRIHPLPAVWRTSAGEALLALVADGHRRADAAHRLGVTVVERPASDLIDLDTPEDVDRYRPPAP